MIVLEAPESTYSTERCPLPNRPLSVITVHVIHEKGDAMAFTIDVFSDLICPWCYIGKRRLSQALAQLGPDMETEVHWRPFQLNPAMPREGMDRQAYRTAKFGSWARSQALDAQVARAGVEVGIQFDFDRMARTPNTSLAHRLVVLGRQEKVEDAVVERLFRAYFTEGYDIGNADVLVAMAVKSGIDGETARRYLDSDEAVRELQAEEARARNLGITGVPFFVLNDVHAMSGAQPAEVLAAGIRKVLERGASSAR
ncbi:putative thiol oxidoreductase, DsbA family, FrnE subfamily [Nitrospira moscoviensis]|uniref:Putative thiol oxidoreductase, DsbA family, FrnE subfamily n=2 Tax=Nitrospira moscoviensis TaxID=42253 RepID=A0A0K2GBW5_NITMO|nr:putative thiol oxidoreductase, DsbA family, FrnE subfamily [Nitrospira moscoviensis]